MSKQKHGEESCKFDFSKVDPNHMSPDIKELMADARACRSRGRTYYCPRCRHYHGGDERRGVLLCSAPASQGGWVIELEVENGVEPMAQCINFESIIEE